MASGHLNWFKREPRGPDSHSEAANKMKGREIVSPNGGNRDPGQNSSLRTEKSILNGFGQTVLPGHSSGGSKYQQQTKRIRVVLWDHRGPPGLPGNCAPPAQPTQPQPLIPSFSTGTLWMPASLQCITYAFLPKEQMYGYPKCSFFLPCVFPTQQKRVDISQIGPKQVKLWNQVKLLTFKLNSHAI